MNIHSYSIQRYGIVLLSALLLTQLDARAQVSIGDTAEYYDTFGRAVATGDFNGDGFDDLAVGVPYEDVGNTYNAGAVDVYYGQAAGGLTAYVHQFWHQNVPSIGDAIAASDQFGLDLAAGDFNGDGYDDLAVGAGGEDIGNIAQGGIVDAGSVNVLYGSPNGLAATGNQLWHQNVAYVQDTAEGSDRFGTALATGDFDGDGFDDLAIGVPFDDVGSIVNAGVVNVIYGSSGGLDVRSDQRWHQDVVHRGSAIEGKAEAGDRFGDALATGDFNSDGFDDLAIGVPYEDVGAVRDAGAVNVLYGSSQRLRGAGDDLWHQNVQWVLSSARSNERFGTALAAGDFIGSGYDALAIGVPFERDFNRGGTVQTFLGSAKGLVGSTQLWHQDVVIGGAAIAGAAEPSDRFGAALVSADFNGDNRDDLAVGVPYEAIGSVAKAGAVNVLYGAPFGFSARNDQLWHQNVSGITGTAQYYDQFGTALAAGDFDGNGMPDLAMGVPFDQADGILYAGAVNVLYSASTGRLSSANDERLFQQYVDPPVAGGEATPPALPEAGDVAGTYTFAAPHPNPFNPQTRFTLQVPQAQQVQLAVYDVLGRRVALLHDGWLEAGTAHTFTFEAAHLPSGTYLIRALGEHFTTTRRVVLLK